ncbi:MULTISPECIES: ribonuclease J [Prochlorococcus]|uniref:ribonuclease J n=1 Tax=Prochlorococcus TaxID=1218 RepID=UPI0007B3E540|nr:MULTISPECIES: ribonuclease J [Prochlorococcus]KZR64887.1 Ribonuclease J 1 [Prochlorococcus marinus str. MIT 1312]KZR79452.1 Ribonuclease J 1 [Prochlorococcus marinus str. MIT 1327]NMO84416.1 ribonuclease J [Prochlorococcus sp. P1344]NMP07371.1 ribonuclease J [Prochlorococcus sp. P1361]NMP14712.1 ribonuclease J [Prochlorococcus sp.P1363]
MTSSSTISRSTSSRDGKAKEPCLRVIPLGGLHEIGKNTCVFEYGDDIMMVDAGLAFPSDGMHGVNVVMPDTSYLRENQKRIRGMIVTHGHEDHIGGIPHHLKHFNIPVIYGPRLAMSMLQGKMEEAGVTDRTTIQTVSPRDVVKVGQHFSVEFIRNTHSMADSFSLAITTPVGSVIFTGDFKFDHTPVDGENFDMARLAHHGEQGVLCLFSDSTNAEVPGFCPPERSVFPALDRHISQADGRVIITTFASSIHRVSMILELAIKNGRKVGLLGRSMLNVIAKARELGYMRAPDDLFVPIKQIRDMPDRETLLLMTGSQGEPLAALSRISRGEHQHVQVKNSDTIIFSASPIPGNTISVVNTIDRLMMLGAKVVYGKGEGIHVSGHGFQEDHKLMLALTKPKFFVPVHGEHRMLICHSKTAQSMGIASENILILDNGDVVQLSADSISKGDSVKAGIELLDASRNGIVDARVLKERQQLAEDGVVTVLAAISTDGVMVAPPRVNLRGVVTAADPRKMSLWTEREISWVLENRWKQFSRQTDGKTPEVDWMGLQREVEVGLGRRMRRELQVEPLLLCLVQPAPGGTPAYKGMADAEPEDRSVTRIRGDRDLASNGRRTPAAAPVKVAAAVSATSTTKKVSEQANVKTQSEPDSAEVPSGRTRRRRSAVA